MENCTFCKIRDKQIPAKLLYEDEDVMAFSDVNPVRPVHLLIVPKQHVPEFFAVADPMLFQKIFSVVQNMIKREGLKDKGYRIVVNGGGAQDVHHLHIHLMGPFMQTAAL
jgi:histidine triad (HIT) family protein